MGLANFTPLSPFRILDTRPASCVQCSADPTFGAATTRKLQLTGVTGLSVGADPIPTDATAVVLNVTEVAGTANSLLTVYPYGTRMPQASNLNFAPGKVIANLVTVTLGQGGAVDIYNAAGTVNVIADVEGYFEPHPSSDALGEFHPISPVRVCDTRSTSGTPACKAHGALGPGGAMLVNVTGVGIGSDSIPADGSAAAVVVNLTGVAGSALTYLSLSPTNANGQCPYSGSTSPKYSMINLSAGLVAANRVMVALGPSSPGGHNTSLCVYNAGGTINVVIDANGWYGTSSAVAGAQYQAIQPTRICDTRVLGGTGCAGHVVTTIASLITVAGQGGIPTVALGTTVVAVIANLTAIAPTTATFLVTYPANVTGPTHPTSTSARVRCCPTLSSCNSPRPRRTRATSTSSTRPAASTPSSISRVGSSNRLIGTRLRRHGGRTRSLRCRDGNVRWSLAVWVGMHSSLHRLALAVLLAGSATAAPLFGARRGPDHARQPRLRRGVPGASARSSR